MKCDEPYEGNEYQGCLKDLNHPGDHERYGTRWPRPTATHELTDDLLDLIPEKWDAHDRDYYIAFEVTNTYLVKVTAESEDAALKQYSDYADLPDLRHETAIDGDVTIRRPSQYERNEAMSGPIGPQIACPDCGKESFRRNWFHNPMRKCHGPIEWRESQNANPKWRWQRQYQAHSGSAMAA